MRILYPYKNALWALRPAKPLGVLSRHPCRNPKPLPLGEGLCMLSWLCIVQSIWAYTPGIRAGAILLGLPPQTKQGCLQSAAQSHYARTHNDSHTKPLHDAMAQMAVNAQMQRHKWLTTCTGAVAPKQGRFGCLPKVLHDAKPTEQATLNTHFQKLYRFIDSLG